MPKAKKLPSGAWRCRVVDHYEIKDGKRRVVFHSITVQDPSRNGKKKCELAAAAWQSQRHEAGLRIGEAVERYIQAKEETLSPSTIRIYKSVAATAFDSIATVRLSNLTSERLQRWIGTYSRTHSPKSVRNAVGLLSATYEMFDERLPRITLPQKRPPELATPTDEEIRLILKASEGTELWKAIVLAAFGTLRRGEIAALDAKDLDGDELTVRHAIVRGENGNVLKAPKTPQSVRTVRLPHPIAEAIRKPSGRLVELQPQSITKAFDKLKKKTGVSFRFHDLRAYAASVRHALGIPDVYIMRAGGWKTDTVLKAVYRRTMSDRTEGFEDRATKHFEELLG